MRILWLALPLLLAACGGRTVPESPGNDAQRQAEMIRKQADAITREAQSNTSAIEQALENESAVVFENRGNLLNEAASNGTEAANSSR